MKSPEMQTRVSERPEAGQNVLTIRIGDRNIIVPRKELYGIPDIGNAIGSKNPTYIRDKLLKARRKNPDINTPLYLDIGERRTALFLPEKDFVLAVNAIIPTIKGGQGSHPKELITLPDRQTITVRGEKKKRVLRLLITAFKEGKPYVLSEELLGFGTTSGIPLSLEQRTTLSQALGRLRHNTLTGTGWDIQSIIVSANGAETRPNGYTLKKEAQKVERKADVPASSLQNILDNLDNKTVLKELVTNGPGKASILEEAKQQIDSLEPQEKVIFLQKTFAILSDPDPGYQDKRDAGLGLLNIMDLKSIDPKQLTKTYVKAVSNLREYLSQDSDPYGEIHMLLEAGKTIAPFIEHSGHITQAWNRVAGLFSGSDRQKILDDIEEIKRLVPTEFSEFDNVVLILLKQGASNRAIAGKLGKEIADIKRSVERLRSKGIEFSSSHRAHGMMSTEQQKQLFEAVKDLRNKGMGNLEIASILETSQEKIQEIARDLIAEGKISRIKDSGRKKKIISS